MAAALGRRWNGTEGFKALCGGEPFPRDLLQELLRRKVTVWNMYGPTETTVYSTCCELTDDQETISVGRPIANTRTYILDTNRQPAPVGVPGELHIGGVGVTRGYINRPGLTAEKFVSDSNANEPGMRLYRTGDLARYLPDGNIVLLGRIDQQVKIRGFRIEPGEIEVVLGQYPGVRETVVVAREDLPGDRRLIAYLVPKAGYNHTAGELRHFLAGKIPDHMIPSSIVLLDSLPLTANGKVDRKALPAPGQARPELKAAFCTPRTPVEQALAEIWQELLGLERVGIHDNFFELGGHSLLATQVLSRINLKFKIIMPLRTFFETPTISALTMLIDTLDWHNRGRVSGPGARDYFESGEI